MVFVFSEGYAVGAPSYTTCRDANGSPATREGSSTVSMIGTASAGGSQKDARPHKPRRPCGRALCTVQDFSLAFSWIGTRAEART